MKIPGPGKAELVFTDENGTKMAGRYNYAFDTFEEIQNIEGYWE